ncbi:hypothetical protein NFI95_05810 [Acetobacteraceae bacterium KSS8]|uniref:Uncharacterized protein n=1 Tax=Endosaccharibacter trunci TaxID=2812733 RepID=A0ABT1W504_9PROT|nr:hypothetical protein [Acetobacteraceae bacterium KSS8]
MSENMHTPGPWFTDPFRENKRIIYGRSVFGEAVAHVACKSASDETVEANARLIATSPCMLASLIAVTDDLQAEIDARYSFHGREPYPSEKRRYDRDMKTVHEARAVIARATGQESAAWPAPDVPLFAENMTRFMRRTGNPEADTFWSLIAFDQWCEQAAFVIPPVPGRAEVAR